MGKIKVMDNALANKIAAGEVIEKVASVVKELVENSIDAKSNIIKIELIDSGIKEIKVVDNGTGMDKTDASIAFIGHATSKIINENDLYFINTLGFRGEALTSIASVAEVELTTSDGESHTKVYIKGGKLEKIEETNRDKGTTIIVKNLFFNTPARLKFLKSLNTELNNVINLIEKLALSNPTISFSLSNNEKEILKTSGSGNLLKVIHEIYGYNISKNMIEIKGENLDYEIYGYISNINISRSNKNNMITFVNGRIVQNSYLNKIITYAYHTLLSVDKYPVVVINIETDPTLIDINIHPTKKDIKFSKIETLEELLFNLIKTSLYPKSTEYKGYIFNKEENQNFNQYLNKEVKEEFNTLFNDNEIIQNDKQNLNLFETNEYNKEEILIHPVGLAFGTYLFANDKDNLYIIDIHAANERINYERYMHKLSELKVRTISLLIPINIEFTKEEFNIINSNKNIINELGITYEEFGINTIRITSHPSWLMEGYEEESLRRIFDLIINLKDKFDRIKFNEKAAIMLSCKMSVKANTNISTFEQEELIKTLFKCEFPYTCPHGRPTIIKYTLYELEKMFKRVV